MLLKLFGVRAIPPNAVQELEQIVERLIFVYSGKADPDRPTELMFEAFGEIEKFTNSEQAAHLLKWVERLRSIVGVIVERPTLRTRLVRRAMRFWDGFITELLPSTDTLSAYLNSVDRAYPGSSLLATGVGLTLSMDAHARIVQASALLNEAQQRHGEARFSSTKQLARVVLDESYPHYVRALAFLETVRTGKRVGGSGRQSRSFGTQIRSLENSLPSDAKSLLDYEAHKIRNAFDHGHVRWIASTDTVEMIDDDWSKNLPVVDLVERLNRMHAATSASMAATLVKGMDWVFRTTQQHLTWESMVENRGAFEAVLRRELAPTISRAELWHAPSVPSSTAPDTR